MISARRASADFVACLTFYTRLPVGALGPPSHDFAAAQWAAPLAGLIVGVCGGIVLAIAIWIGLPPPLAAILAVAATTLITGALHEDGLADTADGFGGGKTRERKLEIMRDSRIGAYGVAALTFSVLLRISALATLPLVTAFVALIAAHTAGRALMPYFLFAVSPARGDGLSANVGDVAQHTALVAAAIGAIALLPLGFWPAIAAACALLVWMFILKTMTGNQIGGHTGDVLGTLEQGGEICVLLAIAAALG